MRRATSAQGKLVQRLKFLSTLSLRRATRLQWLNSSVESISIHALLAESDRQTVLQFHRIPQFLSTLSLRRATPCNFVANYMDKYFYPRSPCGERRATTAQHVAKFNFYPRSPCGERQFLLLRKRAVNGFLSTLSLRRATVKFYSVLQAAYRISIHALLAESDCRLFFLSPSSKHFYPRSPCGERPSSLILSNSEEIISIHALLAESDLITILLRTLPSKFLSTLSLRRATLNLQ